jgi:phosphoribosylanthranilate isomerase
MTPEIKFCGMTRAEDVAEAAALGAQYVGVILAGGPRHQTVDGAARVLGGTAPPPKRVGVVAEQTPEELREIVTALSLDIVQLHADPAPGRLDDVRRVTSAELWAAIRLEGATLPPSVGDLAAAADAIVLDARVPGGLGGSGVTLPWAELGAALEPLRGSTRIILAGGLRPENVAAAIAAMAPDAVDVSSGVETSPGVKDHQLMRAFRDEVQRAGAKAHR